MREFIKQKFVVTEDSIIWGRNALHRDFTKKKIISGGWWFIDAEENTLYLYAKSEDFGQFTKEQADKYKKDFLCRLDRRGDKFKIIIDDESKYTILELLSQHMSDERALKLVKSNDFI